MEFILGNGPIPIIFFLISLDSEAKIKIGIKNTRSLKVNNILLK